MSKKEKNKRFRGDLWFDAHVHYRVMEELKWQNSHFEATHQHDTDQELLDYVKECAWGLGFTPWAAEIIGGPYIQKRFGGSWERVLKRADLTSNRFLPPLKSRKLYKDEYKRQSKLFKLERREKKAEKVSALEAQAAERAQERSELRERDSQWAEAHRGLTDEELLDYVRQCAAELGHPPMTKEVEGGRYIANRFCGWPVCLQLAGVGFPLGMQPPKPRQMQDYRRKQKLAAQRAEQSEQVEKKNDEE